MCLHLQTPQHNFPRKSGTPPHNPGRGTTPSLIPLSLGTREWMNGSESRLPGCPKPSRPPAVTHPQPPPTFPPRHWKVDFCQLSSFPNRGAPRFLWCPWRSEGHSPGLGPPRARRDPHTELNPSPEVSQAGLHGARSNPRSLKVSCPWKGVNGRTFKVSPHPNHPGSSQVQRGRSGAVTPRGQRRPRGPRPERDPRDEPWRWRWRCRAYPERCSRRRPRCSSGASPSRDRRRRRQRGR